MVFCNCELYLVRFKRAEAEYSDSLIYPSNWGGGGVSSDFPKFPGLRKYPHREVCLSVCLSLPWADPALSKLIYPIALRLGITQSYRPVS